MSNVTTTIKHPTHLRTGLDLTHAARFARAVVDREGDSAPIEIVAGDTAPRAAGRSYYWTTPGGKAIQYPNAYRWPKVYHASSRRIEVGVDWLVARGA